MKNKLPYSPVQKLIEILSLSLFVGYLTYLLIVWPSLPEYVATRWTLAGDPNGWGTKYSLFAPPIVIVGLFFLFFILSHFPSIWDAPLKLNDQNRAAIYQRISTLLIGLTPVIIILFWYLTICSSRSEAVGIWLAPFFLLFMAVWIFLNIRYIRHYVRGDKVHHEK